MNDVPMGADEYARRVSEAADQWEKRLEQIPDSAWRNAAARTKCRCGQSGAALALVLVGLILWPFGALALVLALRNIAAAPHMHSGCRARMAAAGVLGVTETALVVAIVTIAVLARH
jgi:hypothetical protein